MGGYWSLEADEWRRDYPIQARVEPQTDPIVEKNTKELERLLSIGMAERRTITMLTTN